MITSRTVGSSLETTHVYRWEHDGTYRCCYKIQTGNTMQLPERTGRGGGGSSRNTKVKVRNKQVRFFTWCISCSINIRYILLDAPKYFKAHLSSIPHRQNGFETLFVTLIHNPIVAKYTRGMGYLRYWAVYQLMNTIDHNYIGQKVKHTLIVARVTSTAYHPPRTRMPMEILPSLVQDCTYGMSSGFVPISCSDQVLARQGRVERKHYVAVRCVSESSLLKLLFHALDTTC